MQTAEESLANGLIDFDQVPSFGADEEEQDFPEEEEAAQGPAVVEMGAAQSSSGVEPEKVDGSRRTTPLYWVRVPKPPLGDDLLKSLQAEFQTHVAKLKTLNVRLGAKRVSVVEILLSVFDDLDTGMCIGQPQPARPASWHASGNPCVTTDDQRLVIHY